ncbi:MAG: hypothetical protein ABJO27_15930 [Pseudoruegeria sp.]
MTQSEQAFMATLTGETLDTTEIKLIKNDFIGAFPRSRAVRPRTTCREMIIPPITTERVDIRTAGMVVFNKVHLNPDFAISDLMAGYPGQLNLPAAMFLAHEMFHVWQWQHRDRTGYHPFKAAAEHLIEDPYLFDDTATPRFLDYGYEQQASLVEEFVCCRALDPKGARTDRLKALISQAIPVQPMSQATEVLVPWDGIEPGLCR